MKWELFTSYFDFFKNGNTIDNGEWKATKGLGGDMIIDKVVCILETNLT